MRFVITSFLVLLVAVAAWLTYLGTIAAKPVVLATDALLFLLVIATVGFALHTRRREHLREPWRQVFHNRLAMVSAVLLAAYAAIGLADSLHFRPALPESTLGAPRRHSGEVLSLLDLALMHARNGVEKTYSAPLAAYAFEKETFELPDGRQGRSYPRLAYGGRHLKDPERERLPDIVSTVVYWGAGALGGWVLFVVGNSGVLALRRRTGFTNAWRSLWYNDEVPWRAILLTLGILGATFTVLYGLSLKYHVFGTDKVGQDVFYMALKSVRTGLVIGTLTTLIMLPFAIALGLAAGYLKGWIDDAVQYLYTTLSSIPGVLLIAAAVLMLQVYMANHPQLFPTVAERADLRLLFLCMILGITSWTGLCRMLRGETLRLSESDYVQAAVALGSLRLTVLARHLLPNVMHIVIIAIVLDFSSLVLAEAVLSYVGVGVDPAMNSWGNMINSARLEMAREPMVWWSLAAAFVFMFALVLPANLFSDAVRDAFDPRIRKQ